MAAFETRTGQVYGPGDRRKRQPEFSAFLDYRNQAIPSRLTCIPVVCDHVSVHHGQEVHTGLKRQPRCWFHCTPTPCSWMNQVEPWFSILLRQRYRVAAVASQEDLQAKIMPCIAEWNWPAPPLHWSTTSGTTVMADAPTTKAA